LAATLLDVYKAATMFLVLTTNLAITAAALLHSVFFKEKILADPQPWHEGLCQLSCPLHCPWGLFIIFNFLFKLFACQADG
jgi:hypothetical protein